MDAAVIRALARLGSLGPSRSFAGAVMARVALPQPRPVVLFHRARAWATQPGHALALAGGYAVSAIVALAVVVPWLLVRLPAIGFLAERALARGTELVGQGVVAAAEWSVESGLTGMLREVPLSGPGIWVAGVLLASGYVGCAIGLHMLLRMPKGKVVVRVRA